MKIDLQPYAYKSEEKGSWLNRPFTLVDNRMTVWNAASNRNWLVALRGGDHYRRWPGDIGGLNTMLSLIQSIPENPYEVEVAKITEWATGEGLGKLLDVVVSLDKMKHLVQLSQTGKLQLWNISSVTRGLPCLAMGEKNLRIFLMGHDVAQIVEGTSITPFDVQLVGNPVPETQLQEGDPDGRGGFELAMSLGDD